MSSKKEVASLARQKKSAQDATKKSTGAAVKIADKRESKRTAKHDKTSPAKTRSKSQQVPATTAAPAAPKEDKAVKAKAAAKKSVPSSAAEDNTNESVTENTTTVTTEAAVTDDGMIRHRKPTQA